MSTALFCPICRRPLEPNPNGVAQCSECTASFQMLLMPQATLTLPADTVSEPPANLDATVSYVGPESSPSRDERAPPGYEILGELGRGGMGVVYRARHLRLGRLCALKMILAGGHASDRERQRFETEARAIARLQHPGIVQVFEIGEHQGHPFMALELCEGGSLDARLRDQPPTPQQAAAMVRDLAVAMQAAHDAKVIHRDLKPGNVLIAGDGTLKVTDFGLAKKLDEDDGQTRTGAIMGTPSYMPPEQAEGKKDLTPVADVYALGAVLYAALTGRPPFRGATPMDTVMQVLDKEPVPVQELNPSVPRDLATICHKCLQKEPGKRYTSARELADDLGRFLNGEPIRARPVGRVERAAKWVRRNPIVSALAAAVFVVLTAGIVVSWRYADEAARQAKDATEFAEEAGKKTKEANDNATRAREEAERATREEGNALDRLRRMEWSNYAGKLLMSQQSFATKNVHLAFQHLDDCPWGMRDWEHGHLRWCFDSSKQTFRGHTNDISSVTWSPDGKRILTGSTDKTAKIWDAEKGIELLTIRGHTALVSSVSWSPDGKRLLTGSYDNTARIWNAENGTTILTLRHSAAITSVSWSPDCKLVLTGILGGAVNIWNAESGTVTLTPKGHKLDVRSVCWSPDGKRVLTGSLDGTAKVWDAENGVELLTLEGHHLTVVSGCWSPDGKRILTGSQDNTAIIWDAAKGSRILTLHGHTGTDCHVSWSPNSRHILTGSTDKTVKVWDAESGKEIRTFKGHTGIITSVGWNPDGQRVLTGSWDSTVKVWDAEKDRSILTLRGQTNLIKSVSWSPDSKRILTGGFGNVPWVWDRDKEQWVLFLVGHSHFVHCVNWSPDGQRLLTGSSDNTARIWDAEKGIESLSFRHPNSVTSVSWSPDGKRILTGSEDRIVRVWDAHQGTEIQALKGHAEGINSVTWSPDGKRILTGSSDKTAKVWDVITGSEILTLQGHTAGIESVSWSPDGKRILTGSGDNTAKAWDAETGTEVLTLSGHKGSVTSVAFSPNSKRILTGSLDNTAKVWDAEKGQEVLALIGHTNWVHCVSWSPDGQRVLTGSSDRTVKLWEADKNLEFLVLNGSSNRVTNVAFSPDGDKVFAWDEKGKVMAWFVKSGQTVTVTTPPMRPNPGLARSHDGRLAAKPEGNQVVVFDLVKLTAALTHPWPLRDAAERKRYHTEQADAAEKEGKWFAVAFHVGRLLLDDPDNAELKKRRDEALRKHDPEKPAP